MVNTFCDLIVITFAYVHIKWASYIIMVYETAIFMSVKPWFDEFILNIINNLLFLDRRLKIEFITKKNPPKNHNTWSTVDKYPKHHMTIFHSIRKRSKRSHDILKFPSIIVNDVILNNKWPDSKWKLTDNKQCKKAET